MEICDNILNSVENKNIARNNDIYRIVLEEFCRESGKSFTFVDETACYGNKVRSLKEEYIYTSRYRELFFEILKRHGYFMRQEIKDAIFYLGNLENPNKNFDVINRYFNSPVIQDISFDGRSRFTIESDRYGKFVFELASILYDKNKKMKEYIEKNHLPNRCHNHAYFMSQIFPDFYAITSLCQSYFRGVYFHSYTYDKESNLIIDLCSNAVINRDRYYSLFNPRDISVILNSDVDDELCDVLLNTSQPYDRCQLLKIALYKYYLNTIHYNGPLEDGPKTYTR